MTGRVVFGLGAVHSCFSELGTAVAALSAGTGDAAGLLTVARASLVHQIRGIATATMATMDTAASTSPLVRRSGGVELQGAEKRLTIGCWWPASRRSCWRCSDDDACGACGPG